MRLPNWVGDICKALPALATLERAGFASLLVTRKPLDELVAGLGRPVWTVGKGIFGPARLLRRIDCPNALLLTFSFGTAAAARLAGKRAVGFSGDYRGPLLYRAVEHPVGPHEVDVLVTLARVAQETFAPDCEWPAAVSRTPRLPLADSHRDAGMKALRQHGVDRPFTVLCPMAVGTRAGHSKVWPHWRELSRRLAADGHRLVVCPGPGEEEACAAAAPEATMLQDLGLGAYAAVCAKADRVFANDSGPLHMAAAVGAPTLGIYGAAVPDLCVPRGAAYIGIDGRWPTVDEVLARAGS